MLLLVTHKLCAQEVGVYFNSNGSSFEGDRPRGVRIVADIGYAIGGYLDWEISEAVRLSLRPGYLVTRTKIRIGDPDNPGQLKDSLRLDVDLFSVPVMAKIFLPKAPKVYFVTGLDLNFTLNNKVVNVIDQEVEQNVEFKDFTLSMAFGFGYQFPIKSTRLNIELRYVQGISNLSEFENTGVLFSRLRSRGLHLTAAFGIPIKRKAND